MDRVALPWSAAGLSPLADRLRCLECKGRIVLVESTPAATDPDLGHDGRLECERCGHAYDLVRGTPRMLRPDADTDTEVKQRTADSFAYEWRRFGRVRPEWAKNFADYLQPLSPESLAGLDLLDVGAGSGRHSLLAARHGARVIAVDVGDSIDVARANLPPEVLTVQADAEALPFDAESFDLVMSIGVLHHLPDTERALTDITRYVRRGGHVHFYLYWIPAHRWHRVVLRAVTAARRITVRLPHRLLHALCYPLAALLELAFVAPYRFLRQRPWGRRLAKKLPLKAYADYPFAVLVNDQFDRFSAPIERRFTREEVVSMLRANRLRDIVVVPNNGWVADGIAVPADPEAR